MRRLEAAVIKKVSVFTIGFRVHVMLSVEVTTIPLISSASGSGLFIIMPLAIHSDPFQVMEINTGFEYILVLYAIVRGVHIRPSGDVIIG